MGKLLYDIRNYPRRSGTSQPQRHNPDLMGEKVKIEEHTIAEYIVFAQKLSRYLKFYNVKNEEAGNWQNFLNNDISYHLAVVSALDSKSWEETWAELMEPVEATPATIKNEYKKYYTWRFDFLYSLMDRLIESYVHSKPLQPWRDDLKALYITSNLEIIYELLHKYYKSSKDLLLKDMGTFFYKDLELQLTQTVTTRLGTLPEVVNEILPQKNVLSDNPDFIFGGNSGITERIDAASEYLDDLARQLIHIYARVNALAEKHLRLSLEKYNEHEPHLGLFYAFLQLLEEHRTEMNSLLLKHLDFYYKQVLYVKPKEFQPSKAYVTFEATKNVYEHFIKTGTSLLAGKDNSGKDIIYLSRQDIIVNKAEPGDIKSFTFIKNEGDVQNERVKTNPGEPVGIFASAIANSKDGKGKALLPGQSWWPFLATSNEINVNAQTGVSFYSALLHKTPDEKRKYRIDLKFEATDINYNLHSFFNEYATVKIFTEKEPLLFPVSGAVLSEGFLQFQFEIPEKSKVSVASPNASILFGKRNTNIAEDFMEAMKLLQSTALASFSITLVNQTIPVTMAETVMGTTDLSSAFPAFGGVPKDGSWFKIIEPLLKGRSVSDLTLIIEWASKTDRKFDVAVGYDQIDNTGSFRDMEILNNVSTSLLPVLSSTDIAVIFTTEAVKIILKSQNDLGYRTYAEDMTRAVLDDNKPDSIFAELADQVQSQATELQKESPIQKVGQEGKGNIQRVLERSGFVKRGFPQPPYTPMIKSIKLICSISEDIFSAKVSWLYLQNPHGYKKIEKEEKAYVIPNTQFEGELYIGFKNLKPSQSLNVLIQVEEGTADPTLPDPEVDWKYLCENEWKPFDSSQFKDGTNSLIQSGIITFASPDIECINNTILPAGQFWIRAGVPFNQTKAVCKIIAVHTQVVMAQFENFNNDASGMGSNLPANSITQLNPKQAAIKKTEQPYASFGGRLQEEDQHLYERTSERLRHKSRAVNVWDYEHIILEAFPGIYKVKVLNHACQDKKDKEKIISKPGEVLVLAVAKTAAQSNVYRPLVSKSQLSEIKTYLKPLASPFINLTVINPLFEEIKIDTIVTFSKGIMDDGYYEKQLQEDIKRFLSPWAYDTGKEPEFGGTIYKASLLNFIEELAYIDFVEKLNIIHQQSISGDFAKASSPASFLISASQHIIEGKIKSDSFQLLNTEVIG